MLWTIAIIFALLWVLGMATSYTFGGFIHLLIIVVFTLLLVRIFSPRSRGHSNG